MTDRRISVRDRVQAIEYLEWLAFELNKAAVWAGDQGCETESDFIDRAGRDVLAAIALLSRPIRPELPPEPWQPAPASAQPPR